MTFGEKAVGLSFNPGGHPVVNQIKRQYADILDTIHRHREEAGHDPEKRRMFSIAITETQSAQMWAVKAATWQIEENESGKETREGPRQADLQAQIPSEDGGGYASLCDDDGA